MEKLGERQIIVDCDVIEADGGTRTASITGGYVALALAVAALEKRKTIKTNPLLSPVAAVSCGIVHGEALLDLDYVEDSGAEVDANLIMTGEGKFVEVQMSGEEATFHEGQLGSLLTLGKDGIRQLIELQQKAIHG